MEIMDAIKNRHSVRNYIDKPIDSEILSNLQNEIDDCNSEGNLHIQLITNEPKAFDSFMAHYGKFSGVKTILLWLARKATNWKKNTNIKVTKFSFSIENTYNV